MHGSEGGSGRPANRFRAANGYQRIRVSGDERAAHTAYWREVDEREDLVTRQLLRNAGSVGERVQRLVASGRLRVEDAGPAPE